MPLFDLPLEKLRSYRPKIDEPGDFDEFWSDLRGGDDSIDVTLAPIGDPWRVVDVFDARFPGGDGAPIAAWLLLPKGITRPVPAVVRYLGYGSGRGLPHQWLMWPAAGFALFVMDTRGQGAGATSDPGFDSAPHEPGFLTSGILTPRDYFYRRVFSDAVRAVDAVRRCPSVDPDAVAVAGVSQGGAIAQAVAGLRNDVVAALVDVPFLTHISRAVEIADRGPYTELVDYCARDRARGEEAMLAMRYFDGVSFAARINAPTLYSVGLRDRVCPPSTVFAAFNQCPGPAEIEVWPFNEHEGGGAQQEQLQAAWLQRLLGLG